MKLRKGKNKQNRNYLRYPAVIMAAFVVFTTTYALVLPALTLERGTAETEPGIVLLQDEEASEEQTAPADAGKNASASEEKVAPTDAGKNASASEEKTASADEEKTPPADDEKDTLQKPADQTNEVCPAQFFTEVVQLTGTTVSVTADEGAFPAGTVMQVADVSADKKVKAAIAERVEGTIETLQALDISFYDVKENQIEPAKEIKVSVTSDQFDQEETPEILHFPDDGSAPEYIQALEESRPKEAPAKDEVVFVSDSFSVYAFVYTQLHTCVLSDSGETYKITVTYDDAARIPEGAELKVKEITAADPQYETLQKEADEALLQAYDTGLINSVLFDIGIYADGTEIEPAEGSVVDVEIQLVSEAAEKLNSEKSERTEPADSVLTVLHHIDGEAPQILSNVNSEVNAQGDLTISFATDSFSKYQIGKSGAWGATDITGNRELFVGDEIYINGTVDIHGSSIAEVKNRGGSYNVIKLKQPGTLRVSGNTGNQKYDYTFTVKAYTTQQETPATIHTVTNEEAGITLHLFDYDLDGVLNEAWNSGGSKPAIPQKSYLDYGINKDKNLKFWTMCPGYNEPYNNGWTDKGDHTYVSGIVGPTLSGGYPTVNGQSLAYLFDPDHKLDDSTNRKAYANADGLFKYDKGYYIYDSSANYAYYPSDGDGGTFEVYNTTYEYKDGSKETKKIGFFPFHPYNAQEDTKLTSISGHQQMNHHFGMAMSAKFAIPTDARDVYDQPITYFFSGDDDMWVFIDDNLALDLGGIHQPVSGKIEFLPAQNGMINVVVSTQDKKTGATEPAWQVQKSFQIRANKEYTLRSFYIERGGGDSNCKIMFNLPTYRTLKLAKRLNGLSEKEYAKYKDEWFTYELKLNNGLYNTPDEAKATASNINYDLRPIVRNADGQIVDSQGNSLGTTETAQNKAQARWMIIENGQIRIKDGWTVEIPHLSRSDTFYVAEEKTLNMDEFEDPHAEREFFTNTDGEHHEEEVSLTKATMEGENPETHTHLADWTTGTYTLQETEKITFTNTLKEKNLIVEKKWSDGKETHANDSIDFRVVAKIKHDGQEGLYSELHPGDHNIWGKVSGKYEASAKTVKEGYVEEQILQQRYTLNAKNNWAMRFEHLPAVTEQNDVITYSVEEVTETAGYASSVTSAEDAFEVDVFKYFPDKSYKDEKIGFYLIKDGKFYTKAGTWGQERDAKEFFLEKNDVQEESYHCRFRDMPDGTYTIKEVDDSNPLTKGLAIYKRPMKRFTIRNEKTKALTLKKQWLDKAGKPTDAFNDSDAELLFDIHQIATTTKTAQTSETVNLGLGVCGRDAYKYLSDSAGTLGGTSMQNIPVPKGSKVTVKLTKRASKASAFEETYAYNKLVNNSWITGEMTVTEQETGQSLIYEFTADADTQVYIHNRCQYWNEFMAEVTVGEVTVTDTVYKSGVKLTKPSWEATLQVPERWEEGDTATAYAYYAIETSNGGTNTVFLRNDITPVASGQLLVKNKETNAPPPTEKVKPAIRKYVEKLPDNDDYDLTLTAKAAPLVPGNKLDILFILDTTGSMRYTMDGQIDPYGHWVENYERWDAIDKAVKDITALLTNERIDARYSMITFATSDQYYGSADTRVDWTTNAGDITGKMDYIRTYGLGGGTNYESAFYELRNGEEDLLGHMRSDAKRLIFFISDGEPNEYYTNGMDTFDGSSGGQVALQHAIEEFGRLPETKPYDGFYAIGVGSDIGMSSLQSLTDASKAPAKATYACRESEAVENALQSILTKIAPVKNVTITDTLSDYAQPVENAKLAITVFDKTNTQVGAEVGTIADTVQLALAETDKNKAATLAAHYDSQSRQLVLDFPDDYELEDGWDYRVTMTIEPTQKAYVEYQTAGYPAGVTGDENTDVKVGTSVTSSGKPGFKSNSTAKITYEDGEETYPDPVIQTLLTKVELLKIDSETNAPLKDAKFHLYRAAKEGDAAESQKQVEGIDGKVVAVAENQVTPDTGLLTFAKLIPGTYYLQEAEAPDLYTGLNGFYTFTVTVGDYDKTHPENWKLLVTAHETTGAVSLSGGDADNKPYQITVPNTKSYGYELPSTGGAGVGGMTGMGAALAAVSGAALLIRKKKA